jgi:hypothetical protein
VARGPHAARQLISNVFFPDLITVTEQGAAQRQEFLKDTF